MIELKKEACLIDGAWRSGDRWIEVDDPATGMIIGRVPQFGAAETGEAIAAGQAAFPAWSSRTAEDRAAHLHRFHALMLDHLEPLAQLLSAEQGKPITEARGEISYAASFVRWFAEEARRVYGEVIPGHLADKRLVVLRQPIGVVAVITPWNFPSAMITRKIAPALAAGCTVIVKPAEATPLSALALAVLAEEAGFPAGVINIVTGNPAEIGDALCASSSVRKLSFTGSTATGALLMAQCAPTIKKLSLELGGNAPFIVFDDADLDAAVAGAINSKYRNTGQTCVCANRFYVQAGIHDRFVGRFTEAVRGLVVGAANEPGVSVGPLIDERAMAKVRSHIADAVHRGGRINLGGVPHGRGGRFFEPTIVTDANATMLAIREETFGPVAPVIRFTDEADAIAQSNDTPFGLAAYFYTRDLARTWRVAEALEVGMVGINTGIISTEVAPFGGVKQSGLGREGSRHGIEDYLELKYLCIDVAT